ncbi:hypothetical protein E2C01_054415 [Portunus trituberculatus]|uniref:Uncharacterized protein n=1 Tax=Portunus trituberculatus TaxID=210409 RepID=A0A5B7GJS4_PORTR|nr:hypothetical protein [Portunus trituberculatus]
MEDQRREKCTESPALEMSKEKEHAERKKTETRKHVGEVTRKARQEDKEQIEIPIRGDERGWRKGRRSQGWGER